jgi:hypothetical protein
LTFGWVAAAVALIVLGQAPGAAARIPLDLRFAWVPDDPATETDAILPAVEPFRPTDTPKQRRRGITP